MRPKICPTHGTELPYPRLAEHLRCDGSKEGQGSQEGDRKPCLVSCPLLPSAVGTASPPPKAAMLTPSEGVISPPAASRRIGGTACRQQTVKRKKTSAESIRKRLPFIKRAFFSCFTSAYAADFWNYSSTFTYTPPLRQDSVAALAIRTGRRPSTAPTATGLSLLIASTKEITWLMNAWL